MYNPQPTIKIFVSNHITKGYKIIYGVFNELHKVIGKYRYYSANEFKNGYRNNENYMPGALIIILDIDSGLSIKEARKIFKDFKYLIITTRNHQKLKNGEICDRFRIILPVNEPIDLDADEFGNLMLNIANHFHSDKNACDAARCYYGHQGEYYYNEGKLFDWREFYTPCKNKKKEPDDRFIKYDRRGKKPFHYFITDRCAQAKNYREKQSNLNYLEWLYGSNIAALCRNGREIAHHYSKLDKQGRYSESALDKAINSCMEKGAIRCDTFCKLNSLCENCIYKGLITSPIQLGHAKITFNRTVEIMPDELINRMEKDKETYDFYCKSETKFATKTPKRDGAIISHATIFDTIYEVSTHRAQLMREHTDYFDMEFMNADYDEFLRYVNETA